MFDDLFSFAHPRDGSVVKRSLREREVLKGSIPDRDVPKTLEK